MAECTNCDQCVFAIHEILHGEQGETYGKAQSCSIHHKVPQITCEDFRNIRSNIDKK